MDLFYPFVLPKLPYDCNALESAISAQTMSFHHDKHFASAVDTLNALLFTAPAYQAWPLTRLIRDWSELPAAIRTQVRRAAGSVYAHDLYFRSMAPASRRAQPSPALLGAMDRAFHGAENFFKIFSAASKDVYGSGFVWLMSDNGGALQLVKTPGHEVLLGLTPILCCDLWEHAYYLDRQNRKEEYISFFPGLIDWDAASQRYDAVLQTPPYPNP